MSTKTYLISCVVGGAAFAAVLVTDAHLPIIRTVYYAMLAVYDGLGLPIN
jgi:hypothetical protein